MNESPLKWQGQRKHSSDDAVSPVIGTILMIAVTVALGAAVYTAVGGMEDQSVEVTNAVFKAQALDTDGNALTDTLKVTYVRGPSDLAESSVAVTVDNNGGTAPTPGHEHSGNWNAGDYVTFTGAGTYFVTVAVGDSSVLDRSLTLDE